VSNVLLESEISRPITVLSRQDYYVLLCAQTLCKFKEPLRLTVSDMILHTIGYQTVVNITRF